jgi:hypothetical protein
MGLLKERAAFKETTAKRALQLQSELGLGSADGTTESLPTLRQNQKLMEFRAELEMNENMFAVRLQDCRNVGVAMPDFEEFSGQRAKAEIR